MNTLCSHPTTQEGAEDLLVASTVVVSETPEGKVGLGGKCDEESDCDGDLTCDPGTKTCTEGGRPFIRSECIVWDDSSPSA